MTEVCSKCGLPKDLCVCESISREAQQIIVRLSNRKFKKVVTTVEGLNPNEVDMEQITKKLKNRLACGGTDKEGVIELQGDHRKRIMPALVELGFARETIDIR